MNWEHAGDEGVNGPKQNWVRLLTRRASPSTPTFCPISIVCPRTFMASGIMSSYHNELVILLGVLRETMATVSSSSDLDRRLGRKSMSLTVIAIILFRGYNCFTLTRY